MDEILSVLKRPSGWPEWPYLRLERRHVLRSGGPFCLLIANQIDDVDPTVYLADEWPPREGWVPDVGLSYQSFDDLVSDGWKPFYLLGATPA